MAGQGVCLWHLHSSERQGLYCTLQQSNYQQLGRLSGAGRGLAAGRRGADGPMLDNLAVHRATDVLRLALAHPRLEVVFQPKYATYLNLVERSGRCGTRWRL